jgi:cellulose biosynthesis protein BcsQ
MTDTAAIPHVFYGAKGGQGTTVTAAATAVAHARAGRRTLLIDAAEHNDTYAALGVAEPVDPDVPVSALPLLDIVTVEDVADPMAHDGYDEIVIDAGRLPGDGPAHTTLVTRSCYLALRRALAVPMPDDVILIAEPGRALGPDDVQAVLGRPVVATIPVDPAVARTVDAGLLSARLPPVLRRAIEPTRTAED